MRIRLRKRNSSRWYFFAGGCFVILAAMIFGLIPSGVMPAGIMLSSAEERPIFEGDRSKPVVSLACNVFWGEEFLPEMLKIFQENDVKITFFIGGSWAKRNPTALTEIVKYGHELGNHSYSHPHPNRLNKTQNQEEIKRTEVLVQSYTNQQTRLYAPPYGEYNDIVLAAARELGYRTIMWSIDTIDWKRPSKDVICQRVLGKLHNGAIILMHPTDPTTKALPELIREIKARGYQIVPITTLLQPAPASRA